MKKLCFAWIVAVGVAGCGSLSPRPDIEGISWGFQAYDDMPVPRDFTFDGSDASWAYRRYENSALNLRCGRFRYVGDRDVGQLVNWYRAQMPEHKWEQASLDFDRSGRKAQIVYTRESESVTIDIVREETPNKPEPYTEIVMWIGCASAVK
jgi:hypothetical protein